MSYQSNNPPPTYYGYPNQHPPPAASNYSYVTTPVMMSIPVYYGHPQPLHLQHSPAPQQVPVLQHPLAPQQVPLLQHLPASQQVPLLQHSPASQQAPTPQHPPAQQQVPPLQQIPIQPTYITNYIPATTPNYTTTTAPNICQQPKTPVVDDAFDWAPATEQNAAEFKHRAYVAGENVYDGPTWIIRARHCGDLVPGKWCTGKSAAFISHGGKEIPVDSFEILLAEEQMVCWQPNCFDKIPSKAIVAGNTHDGEPLYIGRVQHIEKAENSQFRQSRILRLARRKTYMINGKVQPSKKNCYITYRGAEVAYKFFDVLCQK